MQKVIYLTFIFVSLGLFFLIFLGNFPNQSECSRASGVAEHKINTVPILVSQNGNETRASMLAHFDYLFKLRQELFLHWGFFITVTMALYGFVLMGDKNSVELTRHVIAFIYTIFSIVIICAFFKILNAGNMCVDDLKFLYISEINKYPEGGLIRRSINYNYMRTFWGCVVEILFFLIPTYFIIYKSKSKYPTKKTK